MILAGFALGASVWAAWPEPTLRIVRLPNGESMPKTARTAVSIRARAPRAARTPAAEPTQAPSQPTLAPAVEVEPVRVLAAVEPDHSPGDGPSPVPSELELSGDYDQESPEELGAEPLPGAVLTPEQPPVAG
jgi:hypothetical protein